MLCYSQSQNFLVQSPKTSYILISMLTLSFHAPKMVRVTIPKRPTFWYAFWACHIAVPKVPGSYSKNVLGNATVPKRPELWSQDTWISNRGNNRKYCVENTKLSWKERETLNRTETVKSAHKWCLFHPKPGTCLDQTTSFNLEWLQAAAPGSRQPNKKRMIFEP